MIRFNGVDIPKPTSYTVGIMDISEAERNAAGTMVIERIATKRKIELMWEYLPKEDLSQILRLVSDVSFFVEYIDPQYDDWRSGQFYVGDRTINGLMYRDGHVIWKDVKFNIIEL